MTAAIEGELARGQLIILRAKTLDDAQQDYAWRRDPELATFDAARPYFGSFYDYMAIVRDELNYPSPYRRTIAAVSLEGVHVGNVMYYNTDVQRREAEIGVTIGMREYWGRGYGTDLIATFVRYMFETMDLDRVHLKTLDWNLRAQRCFEKVGFQPYGTSKRGEYSFVLMEILRGRVLGETAPVDSKSAVP